MQKNDLPAGAVCEGWALCRRSARVGNRYNAKTLLAMKLTIFLLTAAFLNVSAKGLSQHVSFTGKDVPLKKVFYEIKKQTGYAVTYTSDILVGAKPISINTKNASLVDFLEKLLADQPIKFTIESKTILLSRKLSPAMVSRRPDGAFKIPDSIENAVDIKGKVVDEKNSPIEGVTISVKGARQSTSTNIDGEFVLNGVRNNAVLIFTHVNYQTQEINVQGKTSLTISLVAKSGELNDIVVLGYGTQKKAAVSGSVVTLDPEELITTPVTNLTNAIAGRLAGVIVNSPGGEPGADDAQVFIRGKATLGSTDALIVIDGIPDRGGFARLNPQDIASFTVLKDASAAIYGARAANGVILITTKRGKTGKPQFSASTNITFAQPTTKRKILDSWQEATLANESLMPGSPPQWNDEQIQLLKDQSQPYQYPNTDWEALLLKKWTPVTNHSVSATGGSESIRYFLSGQYLKQDGVFKGNNFPYKQISLRANLDVKLTKDLSLGVDILNRSENRNYWERGDGKDGWNTPWNYVRRGARYLVAYHENGLVGKGFQAGEPNVAESISPRAGFTESKDNIINTKITLSWNTPVKGLNLSGYGAFDPRSYSYTQFQNIWDEYLYDYATDAYTKVGNDTKRRLEQRKSDYSVNTYNVKLAYEKSLNYHHFDAFVAYEQSRYENSFLIASRVGLPSAQLPELFTGEAAGQNNNGYSEASGRINYFGRVNYDYQGKYLATFSLRRDGSQNFPPEKRYGMFPGISLGWRISEEPFLKNIDAINNLKIRASWGKMGNDKVDAFQYLTTYAYPNYSLYCCGVLTGYDFGNGTLPGIFESTTANPNITWETATTANIGLEGSLFNNTINFEFDYFKSKREGILIARNASVPEYTGLTLPDENLGIVNNHGFEIQLSTRRKIGKDFLLDVSANMSYAHNEVEFYDEPAGVKEYQKREGRPIDAWLVYEAMGIYQTKDAVDATPHYNAETGAGDIQIKDLSNDGLITTDDSRRNNYGQVPEIMYGINLGLSYKNFDLSVLFQGQAHSSLSLRDPVSNALPFENKMFFENRWGNGNSTYPRIYDGSGYGGSSTFWIRKGDFLRLKNLSLAYNFPKKFLGPKLNAQLYLRGNNLVLLYDDIEGNWRDPEENFGVYPIQRSWQFGLSIGF